MIDYTINITNMDCFPDHEGEKDVVFSVSYTVIGTSGSYTNGVTASQIIQYDAASSCPYIPYDQLTKDDVVGWIETHSDPDTLPRIKESIRVAIEDMINPKIVSLPPPFAN